MAYIWNLLRFGANWRWEQWSRPEKKQPVVRAKTWPVFVIKDNPMPRDKKAEIVLWGAEQVWVI